MDPGLNKALFGFLFPFMLLLGTSYYSEASNPAEKMHGHDPKSGDKKIETEWGGHIKARAKASRHEDESVFRPVGKGTYYDRSLEGRLKNRIFLEEWGQFETHYEAVYFGGDTRAKTGDLKDLFPGFFDYGLLSYGPTEDDRRFMDLTKTINESRRSVLYHRLDRLCLSLFSDWGTLRIGRQAITWGNGLLFNPMDLFNPFSPTEIERDYKTGDDMLHAQFPASGFGDFQFLLVPRRNPLTGDAESSKSSVAGKLHFARGTTEFDLMMARHFQDTVAGFGATGYLMGAAWRVDVTGTILDDKTDRHGYLSINANMDYSWVWWNKNFYGFAELFYNGIGEDSCPSALARPALMERIRRGEVFTLGRVYLSGHVKMELHPLLNVFLTVINNMQDPSGILQPYAVWDVARDFQITLGAKIPCGGGDTEFGGFRIPGTKLINKPADSAYLRLTWYF